MSLLYTGLRQVLSLALELYYVDIQSTGRENIPVKGPVIFAANHPNSIMDTVILGAQTNRQISYMAKSGLFKNPLVAWLFNQCGVIPVYRNPAGGKSNDDAFRKAFEVLEESGTIGIFPEGRNSQEREMYDIKTGTARIALGAARRNEYDLDVQIVPVGLNFENRDQFLTSVLVRFGEPISVKDFATQHAADERAAVRALTDEIQVRLRMLATHIDGNRAIEIVRDILEIYGSRLLQAVLERRQEERENVSVLFDDLREDDFDMSSLEEDILRADDPRGLRGWLFDELKQTENKHDLEEEFFLKQRVADALAYYEEHEPGLVDELRMRVWKYKDHLRQVRLRNDFVSGDPNTLSFRKEALKFTAYMIGCALPAAWGFVHNAIPYFITWSASIRAPDEAQRAITGLLVGAAVYPLMYAGPVYAAWIYGSWWIALLYLISMPLTGFFFLRYRRQLARYRGRILTRTLFQTERGLVESLQKERDELIDDFDKLREDFLAAESAGLVKPRLSGEVETEEEQE